MEMAAQWAVDAEEVFDSKGTYESTDDWLGHLYGTIQMAQMWAAVTTASACDVGMTVADLLPAVPQPLDIPDDGQ
jgi:hypothetical protein